MIGSTLARRLDTKRALSWMGTLLVAGLGLGVAACGGPIDGDSSSSAEQAKDDTPKVPEQLKELPYEVHHYGDGWFAPDEPRLRPGIQAIKFPGDDLQSDIEILQKNTKSGDVKARLTDDAAKRFADKDGGGSDLVMGGQLNYQVQDVVRQTEKVAVLKVSTYHPFAVLWGDWNIDKDIYLPKSAYEEGGADSIDIPYDELYGEKADNTVRLGKWKDMEMKKNFETRSQPLRSRIEGDPTLNVPFPKEAVDFNNQSDTVRAGIEHTGHLNVGLGYKATFHYEGQIYYHYDVGVGEDEFKWPNDAKDEMDSSWCDDNAQFDLNAYWDPPLADKKGAGGEVCIQKIGMNLEFTPHVELHNQLQASVSAPVFELFTAEDIANKLNLPRCLPKKIDIPIAGPISFKNNVCIKGKVSVGPRGKASIAQTTTASLTVRFGFMCNPYGGKGCYALPRKNPAFDPDLDIDFNVNGSVGAVLSASFGPEVEHEFGATGIDAITLQGGYTAFLWTGKVAYDPGSTEPCVVSKFLVGPEAGVEVEAEVSIPKTDVGGTLPIFEVSRSTQIRLAKNELRGLCLGSRKDSDGDGLFDAIEKNVSNTNPNKADTDGDGCNDKREFEEMENASPTKADTDNDGLNDCKEVKNGCEIGKSDTDGDGYSDAREVEMGTDCDDASSVPRPLLLRLEWDTYADLDISAKVPAGDTIDELTRGPRSGHVVGASSHGCRWDRCSKSGGPYYEMVQWPPKTELEAGTYTVYVDYFNQQPANSPKSASFTVKAYKAYTWKNAQSQGPFKTWSGTVGPNNGKASFNLDL